MELLGYPQAFCPIPVSAFLIAKQEFQMTSHPFAFDRTFVANALSLLQGLTNGTRGTARERALPLIRSLKQHDLQVGIGDEGHCREDACEAVFFQQLDGFRSTMLGLLQLAYHTQDRAAQPQRVGQRPMLWDLATHCNGSFNNVKGISIPAALFLNHGSGR